MTNAVVIVTTPNVLPLSCSTTKPDCLIRATGALTGLGCTCRADRRAGSSAQVRTPRRRRSGRRSPSLGAWSERPADRSWARDGMFGVDSEQNDERFLLTVDDVFDITGRGRAVIGPIESGSIRSGDQIEVVHHDEVVATANAIVEMPTGRMIASNSVALVLRDLTGESPQPGDVIRHQDL